MTNHEDPSCEDNANGGGGGGGVACTSSSSSCSSNFAQQQAIQQQQQRMDAAAQRRATRDRCMQDELTCSVCLDLFDNPVILECSHNLCRECAERLLNANEKRFLELCCSCGFMRPKRKQSIQCPLCLTNTPVTTKRPLKPNLALRNLVFQFKAGRVLSPEPQPRPLPLPPLYPQQQHVRMSSSGNLVHPFPHPDSAASPSPSPPPNPNPTAAITAAPTPPSTVMRTAAVGVSGGDSSNTSGGAAALVPPAEFLVEDGDLEGAAALVAAPATGSSTLDPVLPDVEATSAPITVTGHHHMGAQLNPTDEPSSHLHSTSNNSSSSAAVVVATVVGPSSSGHEEVLVCDFDDKS